MKTLNYPRKKPYLDRAEDSFLDYIACSKWFSFVLYSSFQNVENKKEKNETCLAHRLNESERNKSHRLTTTKQS